MPPAVSEEPIELCGRNAFGEKLFVDERCFAVEHEASLPVDLAFLRGVDLGKIDSLVVEKDLHIIE